jgi:DMSO reductase anchor subunit
MLFISITFLSGLFSIFHLGRPFRAWRALANPQKSPLSREIILYVLYSLISCISIIYEFPWLIITASFTGLLLLIVVDSVYLYSADNLKINVHSGQTFITALIIISFLSGNSVPFIFVAVIKLALLTYGVLNDLENRLNSVLRFLRISLLIIVMASSMSEISYSETTVLVIFLAGELLDRILFYIDFKPLSTKNSIDNYIAEITYEKERD